MVRILEVRTTLSTKDEALLLSRKLVSERLAACGQVIPGLQSVFNWEGRVQESAETLLVLKTTRDTWPMLRDRLTELHPYTTPEIVATEIDQGSYEYLNWVRECASP